MSVMQCEIREKLIASVKAEYGVSPACEIRIADGGWLMVFPVKDDALLSVALDGGNIVSHSLVKPSADPIPAMRAMLRGRPLH